MQENGKKILNLIYIFSIITLVSSAFMMLYYILYTTIESSRELTDAYLIMNWVCLSFAVSVIGLIFLNIFTKDKHFWLEIAFLALGILAMIALIIAYASVFKGSLYVSYEMARFELLSALVLLLSSRLGLYFMKRKEAKNEKV